MGVLKSSSHRNGNSRSGNSSNRSSSSMICLLLVAAAAVPLAEAGTLKERRVEIKPPTAPAAAVSAGQAREISIGDDIRKDLQQIQNTLLRKPDNGNTSDDSAAKMEDHQDDDADDLTLTTGKTIPADDGDTDVALLEDNKPVYHIVEPKLKKREGTPDISSFVFPVKPAASSERRTAIPINRFGVSEIKSPLYQLQQQLLNAGRVATSSAAPPPAATAATSEEYYWDTEGDADYLADRSRVSGSYYPTPSSQQRTVQHLQQSLLHHQPKVNYQQLNPQEVNVINLNHQQRVQHGQQLNERQTQELKHKHLLQLQQQQQQQQHYNQQQQKQPDYSHQHHQFYQQHQKQQHFHQQQNSHQSFHPNHNGHHQTHQQSPLPPTPPEVDTFNIVITKNSTGFPKAQKLKLFPGSQVIAHHLGPRVTSPEQLQAVVGSAVRAAVTSDGALALEEAVAQVVESPGYPTTVNVINSSITDLTEIESAINTLLGADVVYRQMTDSSPEHPSLALGYINDTKNSVVNKLLNKTLGISNIESNSSRTNVVNIFIINVIGEIDDLLDVNNWTSSEPIIDLGELKSQKRKDLEQSKHELVKLQYDKNLKNKMTKDTTTEAQQTVPIIVGSKISNTNGINLNQNTVLNLLPDFIRATTITPVVPIFNISLHQALGTKPSVLGLLPNEIFDIEKTTVDLYDNSTRGGVIRKPFSNLNPSNINSNILSLGYPSKHYQHTAFTASDVEQPRPVPTNPYDFRANYGAMYNFNPNRVLKVSPPTSTPQRTRASIVPVPQLLTSNSIPAFGSSRQPAVNSLQSANLPLMHDENNPINTEKIGRIEEFVQAESELNVVSHPVKSKTSVPEELTTDVLDIDLFNILNFTRGNTNTELTEVPKFVKIQKNVSAKPVAAKRKNKGANVKSESEGIMSMDSMMKAFAIGALPSSVAVASALWPVWAPLVFGRKRRKRDAKPKDNDPAWYSLLNGSRYHGKLMELQNENGLNNGTKTSSSSIKMSDLAALIQEASHSTVNMMSNAITPADHFEDHNNGTTTLTTKHSVPNTDLNTISRTTKKFIGTGNGDDTNNESTHIYASIENNLNKGAETPHQDTASEIIDNDNSRTTNVYSPSNADNFPSVWTTALYATEKAIKNNDLLTDIKQPIAETNEIASFYANRQHATIEDNNNLMEEPSSQYIPTGNETPILSESTLKYDSIKNDSAETSKKYATTIFSSDKPPMNRFDAMTPSIFKLQSMLAESTTRKSVFMTTNNFENGKSPAQDIALVSNFLNTALNGWTNGEKNDLHKTTDAYIQLDISNVTPDRKETGNTDSSIVLIDKLSGDVTPLHSFGTTSSYQLKKGDDKFSKYKLDALKNKRTSANTKNTIHHKIHVSSDDLITSPVTTATTVASIRTARPTVVSLRAGAAAAAAAAATTTTTTTTTTAAPDTGAFSYFSLLATAITNPSQEMANAMALVGTITVYSAAALMPIWLPMVVGRRRRRSLDDTELLHRASDAVSHDLDDKIKRNYDKLSRPSFKKYSAGYKSTKGSLKQSHRKF